MSRRQSDRLSGRVESTPALAQAGATDVVAKTNDSAARTLSPSRRPPRLSLARLASITDRLDERDLGVVATLDRVRMATGDHLRRIHFEDVPSSDRQARRVLGRLVELGVLARLERVVGGRRAGSTGFIYSLGTAGQRLAGSRGPAKGRRLQQPWTPSSPYLTHLLTVTELYVRLKEHGGTGEFDLLNFDAEPACWRSFMGHGGDRLWLKPDAFVRVSVGDTERLHFVEIDCGTESPRTLDRKLERYRRYAGSGAEIERWGVHPFVTWFAPDARRVQVVVDACGRTPAELWPLFQVAVFDRAVSTLLGGTS